MKTILFILILFCTSCIPIYTITDDMYYQPRARDIYPIYHYPTQSYYPLFPYYQQSFYYPQTIIQIQQAKPPVIQNNGSNRVNRVDRGELRKH